MINTTKVLYKKYDEDIFIGGVNGRVILYNHSDKVEPKFGVFTGISLKVDPKVKLHIEDLMDNKVDYIINKGFIEVYIDDDDKAYGAPICIVNFIPRTSDFGFEEFNGILIETFSEENNDER